MWTFLHGPAYPHMDPRDAAFPFGFKPTEADRNLVAPNELATPFMGGRHTVDGNEPDVQTLAQWTMAHVHDCLHAEFPHATKVSLSRVLKAEKQLMTVLDCRYFLVIEATVRPSESAQMLEGGTVPQDALCVFSLTLNRNLHDDPTMGICKVLHEEELSRRGASGAPTSFELLGPDADLTFNT